MAIIDNLKSLVERYQVAKANGSLEIFRSKCIKK